MTLRLTTGPGVLVSLGAPALPRRPPPPIPSPLRSRYPSSSGAAARMQLSKQGCNPGCKGESSRSLLRAGRPPPTLTPDCPFSPGLLCFFAPPRSALLQAGTASMRSGSTSGAPSPWPRRSTTPSPATPTSSMPCRRRSCSTGSGTSPSPSSRRCSQVEPEPPRRQ